MTDTLILLLCLIFFSILLSLVQHRLTLARLCSCCGAVVEYGCDDEWLECPECGLRERVRERAATR